VVGIPGWVEREVHYEARLIPVLWENVHNEARLIPVLWEK